MQLSQDTLGGIFYPISAQQLTKLAQKDILFQIQVSFQRFQKHTHLLILTKVALILKKIIQFGSMSSQNQVYGANIQFDLNFQFQSAVQDNILTQKIGISFLKEPNKIFSVFSLEENSVINMRNNLAKVINERRFHQQYMPFGKIGKGNFATVYSVIKVQTKEKFAVKAFSKESIFDRQKGKQSLQSQLEILRTVSHTSDNLLKLYGVYQSKKSIYAVQNLLKGRNLQQLVTTDRPKGFNYDESRYIMLGILNGLKTLHGMKIMHRDLKPENITFRIQELNAPYQFDPVIVDYGMCTNYQKSPYIFYKCGTPGYVAPQVANMQVLQPYSPACDMFSVGCLFHLIITGCKLFDCQYYQETLRRNKMLQYKIKENRVNRNHHLAMDLLLRLLHLAPQKRITAQQALQHDYFGNLKVMRVIPQIKQQTNEVIDLQVVQRNQILRSNSYISKKGSLNQEIQPNSAKFKINKFKSLQFFELPGSNQKMQQRSLTSVKTSEIINTQALTPLAPRRNFYHA